MAEARILVTTSWDDGHTLDTRLAQLLADCACKGTFYVSPLSRELSQANRLSKSSLLDLSTRFEVGSHTLTHPKLTKLRPTEADHEITAGKSTLEDIIGKPVTSFCYPYGAYDLSHVEMIRQAGFRVGRTTRRFNTEGSVDPLQMATTTHAARYKADVVNVPRVTVSPVTMLRTWRNWDELARRVFERAYVDGGVIHLWGHSWEIEQNSDWSRLSRLLNELASHDNVTMLTNAELGEYMRNAA